MSAVFTDLSWPSPRTLVEDQRFRSALTATLLIVLLLGILIPLYQMPEEDPLGDTEIPERYAKLLLQDAGNDAQPAPKPEPAPEPAPDPVPAPEPETQPETVPEPDPAPAPKPVEQPKPEPKPAKKPPPPTRAERVEKARAKAQRSGLLAAQDTFADLRRSTVRDSVSANRSLSTSGSATSSAASTSDSLLTADTSGSSSGIDTSSVNRNTAQSSLSGRSTTSVGTSPVESQTRRAAASRPAGGRSGGRTGGSSSRSYESIQLVFDRNKGALYRIYNKALRKDPNLRGKIVLKVTIAPSGKVTACSIVSSDLNEATVERKVIARVKLLNFGAAKVSTTTVTYPIYFQPS